jgi:hypothetical protein
LTESAEKVRALVAADPPGLLPILIIYLIIGWHRLTLLGRHLGTDIFPRWMRANSVYGCALRPHASERTEEIAQNDA